MAEVTPKSEGHLRYGVIFLGMAAVLVWRASFGGWRWVLLWPAASFALMALAYLRVGPSLLGKRSDGRLAWPRALVLLPYLALMHLAWHTLRIVRRAPAFDPLWPDVVLGRRLLDAETADERVGRVLDLTCEFEEPASMRKDIDYWLVPTLDQTAPDAQQLLDIVDRIGASRTDDATVTYVHCAEGHGRAGTVAVSLAIARGEADDVASAIEWVRQHRPGVRLSTHQRRRVQEILPALLARRS